MINTFDNNRVMSRQNLMPLAPLLVFLISVATLRGAPAQIILVDRGLPSGAAPEVRPRSGLHPGWPKDGQYFLGDDFSVGASGEVWIIDTIRTWAFADDAPKPLFDKITLYGGLAGQPIPKEQAECACHGVVAIKTAEAPGSPDVLVTPATYRGVAGHLEDGKSFRLWQVEFRNLRWSVPGGTGLQFAVKAETSRSWHNGASAVGAPHRLRVFDSAGQLRSFLDDAENRINVQIWGHLSIRVAIRRAGDVIETLLSGAPAFDVTQVDTASLRLGERRFGPLGAEIRRGDAPEIPDLSVRFRAGGIDIPGNSISICLTGKRLDGVPFEGCDLLVAGKP